MSKRNFRRRASSDGAKISEVREYLKGYADFRNLLAIKTEDRKYFGNPTKISNDQGCEGDEPFQIAMLRMKLLERRRFVLSLPAGDEKVFLFLRYLHGETMESCAERMGVAVRTAYRIHKSALLMASERLPEFLESLNRYPCVE